MLTFLAGIGIQIGNHTWVFDSSLLVYAAVAALVGLVAEFLVGWRLPFGIIGAFIVGFIGIWLMTQVIIITGLPNFSIDNVQLIPALIGSNILVIVWHVITYPFWRNRHNFYRP